MQHILHEQGRIDSSDNYVVASECEWTKAIIRLIPEGQWVEKGDIVVELDSSELQDRLRQREILIINAQAALVQAQEVVRLQKLENESAIAKAQLTKKLADLDLRKYIKGDFPKELKAGEGAVALAEEDVTRARERYEYVAYMAKKGYESPSAVEQERISTLKYEQALNKAKKALDLLVKYTSPRKIEELKSLASKAEMELARVDKTAELALANREILVTQRESQLKNHQDYADRMIRNIAACTIRAPVTGEIVYANEGSRRNEILEGEMVRNRQEVVRVPNLDQLEVDVRIHESQIEGIVNGLSASITLDAYPNLLLNGEVTSVSSVPTNGTGYNYDFKEYDVTVRLVGPSDQLEGLMPGLNAKVDIHVAERRDCLHIPAQSVVEIAGELVVFVNTDQGIEHRQIQVGMKSDTGVEVLSGLQQGEEVLLGPRTNCSEQIAVLREQFGSETRVDNIGG
ncbi:MAG: HlyD family efflux transporter periplasmic adaptor subunit [Planctomycetaceae bacterium]